MLFVISEPKRLANLAKHGIDMAEFEIAFSWDRHVILPAKASRTGRSRERLVGTMNGRMVTAVVSPLGTEALALVSVRPAAEHEREAYGRDD